VLGVGAHVVPVRQHTFDRTEFKARRVIDDRELLHRINAGTTSSGRRS
jgi:phenylacetate-CoA ligase